MASENPLSAAYKSGMRGSEKPRRGKLKEVRVVIADNGYMVHHHHEDAKDSKGHPIFMSGDSKQPKVFEDIEGLLDHLKEALKK